MRNFYNLPKNKILKKVYGKGVHQFQADPMIDLTKCKCCQGCDEIDCKGCMWGITMGPNAGCCPSKNESLIFEHNRPFASYQSDCCKFLQGPNHFGYQCCQTTKVEAPNVRYSYHYVGKFFRMDYSATGNLYRNGDVAGWPQNNLPRLCSWCDPSSNKANGYCDCMDYALGGGGGGPVDDVEPDSPCNIGYGGGGCVGPFARCLCMGEGVLRNYRKGVQRLSHYRRKEMERQEYYRWLLDLMCYDNGNVLKNPWLISEPPNGLQIIPDSGTLYNHLVGVVHCEHWWEIDRCPENPDVDFAAEGFTNINTSCYVPRFWIQACSGVPVFDWEFLDAVDDGYLAEGDLTEVWAAMGLRQTPPQDIMNRMSQGGYFETGDWRQPALNEIAELKTRTYTKDAYANVDIPLCSEFKYLGPVRKKFFRDNVFVKQDNPNEWSLGIPAFLDPRKARKNIVNRIPDPIEEESLQLPDEYLVDPWNGNYPTIPDGGWPPGTPAEVIEEYEDFVAWRNTQWVYFHARPGGWDYVCPAYYNESAPNPGIKIPDLPRRYMNDSITCDDPEETSSTLQTTFGGCLASVLGIPQRTFTTDCGGGPPNGCPNAVNYGCGGFVCPDIECNPVGKCEAYREQGGGAPGCGAVMVDSNCEGMVFAYSRQAPRFCGIDRVYFWGTTRQTQAWLYKVNITSGEYGSSCPHYCRSLSTPKPISTNFESIYKNKPAHRYLCNNYYHPYPSSRCPGIEIPEGKYCWPFNRCVFYAPGGEICNDNFPNDADCTTWCPPEDGSGGGAPYYWGGEIECCRKSAGPTLPPDPIPVDYTHPAFTNINCDNCGPGTIYQTENNYCATGKGCCYNCCEPLAGPTFISQSECYQAIGDDPDDPLWAHILWVPSANGVDCSINPSPCNPPYPACSSTDPLVYCCVGTNCSGPIPQSQCLGTGYSTQIECESNCTTPDPLGFCCSQGSCSNTTQSQCSGTWYSTQSECLSQCSGSGGNGYCCLEGNCLGPNFSEADCTGNGGNWYSTGSQCQANCV